jgi:hypothetical protein
LQHCDLDRLWRDTDTRGIGDAGFWSNAVWEVSPQLSAYPDEPKVPQPKEHPFWNHLAWIAY